MAWSLALRETYVVTRHSEDVRISLLFQPQVRLIVSAQLINGVGMRERSLGHLAEMLLIDDLGEVKGALFPLSPAAQLVIPTTEFTFNLLYQPLARHYSFELSIWVDTMPIANPSAPNYPVSTVATPTTVASSATSTPILEANADRKGATVWNASTATLYLDLDAAATLTDYAARLDPGGYYEVPYGFTGALSGIWSAVNGSALVREFT